MLDKLLSAAWFRVDPEKPFREQGLPGALAAFLEDYDWEWVDESRKCRVSLVGSQEILLCWDDKVELWRGGELVRTYSLEVDS